MREAEANFGVAASPDPAPIADRSYRGYDGPLTGRALRWWKVALASIRPLRKRTWFWVLGGLSLLPYLFVGFQVYGRSQAKMMQAFFSGGAQPHFAEYFYQGLTNQLFWLFLLALLVGSGVISADLRANALQIYLARPITRLDYLVGKWFAIFLPLYAFALAPALLLYIFCFLGYFHEGFWKEDHWLILRVFAASAIPGAVHASLLCGFSAWSRSPRLAGALYGGLYLVSAILTSVVWLMRYRGDMAKGALVRSLSLPGLMTALSQHAYHVVLHFEGFHRRKGIPQNLTLHPPSLSIVMGVTLVIAIIAVASAQQRIRAVEVVRG